MGTAHRVEHFTFSRNQPKATVWRSRWGGGGGGGDALEWLGVTRASEPLVILRTSALRDVLRGRF